MIHMRNYVKLVQVQLRVELKALLLIQGGVQTDRSWHITDACWQRITPPLSLRAPRSDTTTINSKKITSTTLKCSQNQQ